MISGNSSEVSSSSGVRRSKELEASWNVLDPIGSSSNSPMEAPNTSGRLISNGGNLEP